MQSTGFGLFWPKLSRLRHLCSLEKIVPEELCHAPHGIQLGQPSEHMSLIRIDSNLIGNFMLLQDAFKLICAVDRCFSYMFFGWVMLNQLPKGSRNTASTP